MSATQPGSKTPIVTLGEAVALVIDAIALAEKGLERNPSREEERELNQTLIDLEERRAEIQAKLDALVDGTQQLAGPTRAQVAQISSLTGQVEAETNASETASGAVTLSARVLALATEIA